MVPGWFVPIFCIFALHQLLQSMASSLDVLNRYGSWGVCFTYAGWFGIKGLVAAGMTYNNSSSIRKACDYMLSKELAGGGWGESYLSCQNKVGLKILFHIFCDFQIQACPFIKSQRISYPL